MTRVTTRTRLMAALMALAVVGALAWIASPPRSGDAATVFVESPATAPSETDARSDAIAPLPIPRSDGAPTPIASSAAEHARPAHEEAARAGAPFEILVVDREARAVAGATLGWWRDGDAARAGRAPPDLSWTTGDDGIVAFERVADVARGAFFAEHPSHGSSGLFRRVEALSPSRLSVTLRPLGRVRGRVEEPDGTPARGVTVVARPEVGINDVRIAFRGYYGGGRDVAPVVTDDEGRFVLDVPPHNEIDLFATRDEIPEGREIPDDATIPIEVQVQPGDAIDVVLYFRTDIELRGSVRDERGDPVPGVTLTAESGAGVWYENEPTVSDAAGRFAMRVSPGGLYDLVASARDWIQREQIVLVLDQGARHPDIVVTMARAARIAGRVVDGDGAPLAGVRVEAWIPVTTMTAGIVDPVTTGADGAFALGPTRPDSRYTVVATPPDRRDGELPLRRDGVRGGAEGLVLVLDEDARRAVTLRGVARDAQTRQPLAGADLVAYPSTSRHIVAWLERGADAWPGKGFGLSRVTADGDGAFAFDGLHRDVPVIVGASADAHDLAIFGPFVPSDGHVPLDVCLVPSVTLRLAVVDEEGHPIARPRVRVVTACSGREMGQGHGDAAGRLVLEAMPRGAYVAFVVGADATHGIPIEVDGSSEEIRCVVPGEVARARLRVDVVDADGTRVPGARVSIQAVGLAGDVPLQLRLDALLLDPAFVGAGADGAHAFADLAPGVYVIAAAAPHGVGAELTSIPSGGDVAVSVIVGE